ncbi:MAG: HAMP domain-containing histidine kinase [Bacteroidales bacterium]|nr:HAMP domain-containing histidine kinase [Bacteroidales bacterium]
MNIYHRKQRWKIYLLIAAIVIVVGSFMFTSDLSKKLAEEERNKVELWAKGMKELTSNKNPNRDYSFILEVIKNNETVPMVLTDENEQVISTRNVNLSEKHREEELRRLIREMKSEHDPIEINLPEGKQYIFYKDSTLLTRLSFFPLIQFAVLALFLFIAYYAFSSAKRAEQNQVWVGMSKETAHQLGTPTSSLLANLELLKMEDLKNPAIVQEVEKDVNRMKKITERFSKIGSKPSLNPENIPAVLMNAVNYIQSRVSRRVAFSLDFDLNREIYVPVNKALFEWVVENLLKNAIDSMNGEGKIKVSLSEKNHLLYIDITDEGVGIPKSKHKTVFQPGYTTRKRGWGLGLSLAKRIVEQYHDGKILVYNSESNKGTTMRVILRK